MLRKITAINELGEKLVMQLDSPETSGLVIKQVQGLGPAKGVINTSALSTADGSSYNSARIEERNIDLHVRYYEVPSAVNDADQSKRYRASIETIRQKTYSMFPVKYPVVLIFETDVRALYIMGYVESNEPDIFSMESSAVIAIRCPDPYFYGYDKNQGVNVVEFASANPKFEFAFSNESLTLPLLVMGDILAVQEKNIDYYGDAPVGMTISIQANGPAENITIFDRTTQEAMRIDTTKLANMMGSPLQAGDEILITTQRGGKSVSLYRSGFKTNIINALDRDADWIQLRRGENIISFAAAEGQTNLIMRISYRVIYEGV